MAWLELEETSLRGASKKPTSRPAKSVEDEAGLSRPHEDVGPGLSRPHEDVGPHRGAQTTSREERSAEPKGDAAPPPSRKKPPRLPGASRTLPPMPVVPEKTAPPKRNHTMEVEMHWLELLEERMKRSASDVPPADTRMESGRHRPTPIEEVLKPRARGKKPIPREDE